MGSMIILPLEEASHNAASLLDVPKEPNAPPSNVESTF